MKVHFLARRPLGTSADLRSLLSQKFDVRMHSVRRWSPVRNRRGFLWRAKSWVLVPEFLNLIRMLASPSLWPGGTVLACTSGHYSALVFARFTNMLGNRKKVYLCYFLVHTMRGNRLVRVILRFLLTADVAIMAQSESEAQYFRSLSQDTDVRWTPYYRPPLEGVDAERAELGEFVFAGGRTNRDYDSLLRCARRLPEIPFIIVAGEINKIREAVPKNVTLFRDLPLAAFYDLMAHSRLVVIPLAHEVGASGQSVALAAMQLGKTTVYSDFDVLQQYFEPEISGIAYAAGDEESLHQTVKGLYAETARLHAIGAQAAQQWREHCSVDSFHRVILDHLVEFTGQ